jgi:hypothetical protein
MKPSISSTMRRARRGKHGAAHHGDLEAAELGQHVERIGVRRQVGPARRLCQQCLLARQPGVVEAGAATDAVAEWRAGELVRQQRGRGGIADSHFAEADHPAALVGESVDDRGATGQRLIALRMAHRRLDQIVARAAGDLGIDQSAAGAEVVRDAGVDDLQLQTVVAREDVDGGSPGKEVLDHLPGHFLRVGGDAGQCCPVVAGEDQQCGWPRSGVSDCWIMPICSARRSSSPSDPGGLVLPSIRACRPGTGVVASIVKFMGATNGGIEAADYTRPRRMISSPPCEN